MWLPKQHQRDTALHIRAMSHSLLQFRRSNAHLLRLKHEITNPLTDTVHYRLYKDFYWKMIKQENMLNGRMSSTKSLS